MNEVSLHEQIQILLERIWRLHSQLSQSDPLRDWIVMEVDALAEFGMPSQSLSAANAALRALKQLRFLVKEHLEQRTNPRPTPPVSSMEESLMTVLARLPSGVLEMASQNRFSIEPSLLFQLDRCNDQFDPVSPTAKVVGYLRGLDPALQFATDFDFAEEGKAILNDLESIDQESLHLMAALFQTRHHTMNAAIAAESVRQVVELAAGVSPRGLQWTRTTHGSIYVESDLPDLMVKKAKMIRNCLMQDSGSPPGILHCASADVLNRESLNELLESIDQRQPFVVVTEGLLLYFEEQELRQFLSNIGQILQRFPCASWVTDIVTQENLSQLMSSHPGVASGVRRTFDLTGRQVIAKNPFATDLDVHKYMSEFDLNIKSCWPLERMAGLLKSDLSVTATQRRSVVGKRQIWQFDWGKK